jgi:hypothetical protein
MRNRLLLSLGSLLVGSSLVQAQIQTQYGAFNVPANAARFTPPPMPAYPYPMPYPYPTQTPYPGYAPTAYPTPMPMPMPMPPVAYPVEYPAPNYGSPAQYVPSPMPSGTQTPPAGKTPAASKDGPCDPETIVSDDASACAAPACPAPPPAHRMHVPHTPCAPHTPCCPLLPILCSCGDPSDSCYQVEVAAVWMRRTTPSATNFLGLADGTEVLNTNQFGFSDQPGLDLSVRFNCDSDVGFDFRYLGIWNVRASTAVGGIPGSTGLVINTTPPTAFAATDNTALAALYSTSLYSGEVNLHAGSGCVRFLGGFRYINLEERFNASLSIPDVDPTLANAGLDVRCRTLNNLYGAQVGLDFDVPVIPSGRLRVAGFGKVGVYAVDATHQVTVAQSADPASVAFASAFNADSARASSTAFVSEVGCEAKLRLTCCCSLTFGYQALWIDGAALASDQINVTGQPSKTDATIPGTGVHFGGSLFLHGVRTGLEFVF